MGCRTVLTGIASYLSDLALRNGNGMIEEGREWQCSSTE